MSGKLEATLTITNTLTDGSETNLTFSTSRATDGRWYRANSVVVAAGGTAKKILFDANNSSFSDQIKNAAGVVAIKAILIVNEGSELDSTTTQPVDNAVFIELMTDVNAGIGTVQMTKNLPSGSFEIIWGDGSHAAYIAGFGGGTIDHIERIMAANLSLTTAAFFGIYVFV